MWGVNVAFGVLATVTAVWISMWVGIHISLGIAALLYGLLTIPAVKLWDRGAARPERATALQRLSAVGSEAPLRTHASTSR
jgi:hypothetical protein